MTDVIDKVARFRVMAGVRSKDTAPELLIRRELHALGFRYRLHNPVLLGKPDLTFPMYKAVIQVNGCFWHRHQCHLFTWPKTRRAFWQAKLGANADRDNRNITDLKSWEREKVPYRALIYNRKPVTGMTARTLAVLLKEWLTLYRLDLYLIFWQNAHSSSE
jgi:DNA mismatch endonuclease (patch repair protein)